MKPSTSKKSRIPRSFIAYLSRSLALSTLAAFGIGQANAANLDWDPAISVGTALGGAGTWNTTLTNWWDGAANVAWPNLTTDTAVFGGALGGAVVINTGSGITANGLTFNTTGYTISGNVAGDVLTLGGATPTLTVTNAGTTATISAIVAGTTGLTKAGLGTLVLSGANTFTGGTSITGGTLVANTVGSVGTSDITVSSGGILQNAHNAALQNWATNVTLDNGSFIHNPGANQQLNFAAGKVLTIGAGGGTVEVSPGAQATSKIFLTAGQLGGAGALSKTGAGVLQLAGANTGFSGTVAINGGTIEFQNPDSLGTVATSITVGNGADIATGGVTNRNNITLQAGGIISANNAAANYTGTINVAGNATVALRQFQTVANANSFAISGPLTGSGNLSVTAPAAATLTLSGNNSGYSGNINVGQNAVVTVANAAAVGTGGYTLTGGTGTARVNIVGANTASPTVGTAGFNGQYFNFGSSEGTAVGVITGVGGNPSVKFAQDQLYLSPRVFARNDAIINMPNSGNGTHTIVPIAGYDYFTVGSSGDNSGGMWKGLLNITNAGTYTFTSASDDNSGLWIDGVLVVNNDQVAGHGLPGPNATGSVTLSAGYHSIVTKFAQGGGGSGMQVSYNGLDTGNTTVFVGSIANTVTNGSLAALQVGPLAVASGTGAIDITADSEASSLSLGTGSTLALTSITVSNLSVSGATTLNATGTDQSITLAPSTGSLTLNGAIGGVGSTGTGALIVAGPFRTTFGATNTYTGTTRVTAGELNLNATGGNAIPTDLTINAPNANGAVANVKLLQANQIADTANVTMTAGILDMGANNDTINGLTLNGGMIIGSGTLTATSATLNNGTINAGLGGSAGLVKSATGTVILGGNNSYTGVTTVTAGGVLQLRNNGALGAAGVGNETTVQAGASLQFAGASTSEDVTINGTGITDPFSAAGAIRSLGGVNTVNNLTTGTASTVRVDSGQLAINGTLNVAGGALTKTGAGTLTFTTNQSSIPAVTLSEGSLGFSGTQSFGAATVPAGLAYLFNSDPSAGVSITAPTGTTVIGNYAVDQTFVSRIAAGSTGTLSITGDNSNNLDFSAGPNVSLGATVPVIYSGTITPNGTNYRLGGGAGALNVTSILSGSNTVEINGRVQLSGANTFNGNITVANGGRLAYVSDTNLGAASNVINLNGGTIQFSNASDNPGVANFGYLGLPIGPSGAGRVISVGAGGGTIDLPARQGGNGGVQLGLLATNQLTGSGALTKTGLGGLYIMSANNFSGGLTLAPNAGRIGLRGAGALANVSSISLGTATELDVDNTNGLGARIAQGAFVADRVNNSAPITFNGGSLLFTPRGAAGQLAETFGAVTLNSAQNAINANSNPGGSVGAVLTFGALTQNTGSTLRIGGNAGTFGAGTAGAPGANNTQITFAGLAAANVLGRVTTFGTDLAAYDTALGMRVATSTVQGAAAFTPVAATYYNLNAAGSATLNAGDSEMLALRFGNNAGQALLFNAAGQRLAINSGGIVTDGNNQARSIGASATRGILTAGPLTGNTTPRELFLHNNQNTLTVFSQIVDNNGQAVSVVKDLDGGATLDATNNSYSGGTFVNRGTLSVTGASGLGSGNVQVRNSRLNINAASAISGSAGSYSVIDQGEIFIGNNTVAYTGGSDRFTFGAGSTLIGSNNFGANQSLNSLTRVTSLTAGGQVVLQPDSIVGHQLFINGENGVGANTVKNLGTNADVYYGLSGNMNTQGATVTVGAGTPWKGISTDRNNRQMLTGTIFANSDFTLQGLTRDGGQASLTLGGVNSPGSVAIVNTTNSQIRANVVGAVAIGDDTTISIPSSLTFVVSSNAIFQPNSSAATGAAGVLVQNGGTLDPGNYVALGAGAAQNVNPDNTLNGFQNLPYPVPSPIIGATTIEAGGRFLINDGSGIGSAPAGTFTMKSNSVLELGTNNAFFGRGDYALNTALPIDTTGLAKVNQFTWEPNVVVRVGADVYKFSQFVPTTDATKTPIIEISGGNRNLTNQTNPFIIAAVGTPQIAPEHLTIANGTILTNDTADRQLNEGRGILKLNDGAVLAGTSQTYLNIQEGIEVAENATITIGSTKWADGSAKLGAVQLTGPNSNIIPNSATVNIMNGAQLAFGAANVWPDTRPISLPNAVTTFPVAVAQGAQPLQPGNGTSLLLNVANFIEYTGAVTGDGAVIGNQGGTALGMNISSAVSSNVVFKSTNGQNPSLVKYGPAKLTLTGASDSAGLLLSQQGEVSVTGTGNWGEVRVQRGGTVTVDNSAIAANNRLGTVDFLVGQGGTFELKGHATTPVTEYFTNIATGSGNFIGQGQFGANSTIKITAGAATTTLSVQNLENFQAAGQRLSSYIVNSPTVANGPLAYGTANQIIPNSGNSANGLLEVFTPNFGANAGFGIGAGTHFGSAGTSIAASRNDFIGDANGDGVPEGFMTQDGVFYASAGTSGTNTVTLPTTVNLAVGMPVTGAGIPANTRIASVVNGTTVTISNNLTAAAGNFNVVVGGMRNLASSEYTPYFRDNYNAGVNVKLSGTATIKGDTRVQTLTMTNGSILNINGAIPLNSTMGRLHLNSGGVFIPDGATATINGGTAGGSHSFLQANAGTSLMLHTWGTLNLNAKVFTDIGVVKTGPGTLNVGAGAFNSYRTNLQVDGGLVTLALGNSLTSVRSQNGSTSGSSLIINAGTLDLNGNSQMINQLASANEAPGMGGTITSASAATITNTGGGRFAGVLGGAISLDKPANNTLLLTSAQTYTGTTAVRAGTLTLRDSGALGASAGAVSVRHATLQFDNGYLSNVSNRINPATPVSLNGATFNLTGAAGQVASQTFNTLTLAGGLNNFTSNAGGGGANEVLIGNLVRPQGPNSTGAYLAFNQNYGFLGTAGNTTTAIRNFITNVNGAPLALNDNIIAGWAIATPGNGSTHFASYNPTTGIGALSNTGDGYATYESGDISLATPTQNVNDGGAARTLTASKTVNAVRFAPGADSTWTLNSGVGLTVDTGGFITDGNQTHRLSPAANAAGMFITSNSGELDVWVQQNTFGINIPVTGSIDLVKAGANTLNLNPAGNYTGITNTSGTNLLSTANTAGLAVGMPISGTGIPAGATITGITPGVSFTISANTSAAVTAAAPVLGNTYTGKTIVTNGTLQLNMGAAGAGPRTNFVAVPGDLLIDAATVTELNVPHQISSAANVTISGGGRLNMVNLAGVTETLNSLTFLDGSSATATSNGLDRTALQLGSVINLAAATAITSTNTNPSTGVPFIGGFAGTVGFTNSGGSTLNINSPTEVNGVLAVGLRFGARIGNVPTGISEGGLIKSGNGLLTLDPDQNPTFGGGNTSVGSALITGIGSTAGLAPGQIISGTNIPANAYIISVDSASQITMSANATVAGATGTITGQTYNLFGSPTTLTDVFNIQSGTVRADRHGALGSPFANTTVQNGAILLGSNTAGQVITGSMTLKGGSTLGATINSFTIGAATDSAANQTIVNLPSGTVNIAAYDYYVPSTNNGNITINAKLTGTGNINLVGPQIMQGSGGGGTLTLGNPLLSGAGAGQNDYSGTINVGTNAILQNQVALIAKNTAVTRTTGNALGNATINLNGGRLRLRDDGQSAGDTANLTVNYGNNVTLSENSFLDANRQTSGSVTNTTINLGTLTVPSGTKSLTVDSGNGYRVGFSSLDGGGTLVKAGGGILNINAIAPTFTGGINIAGPQGLTVGPNFNVLNASNLVLPTSATVPNFSVNGLYITEASKTLNVTGNFAVNANPGDVLTGQANVAGRVGIQNTTTITAGTITNNGVIGPIGGAVTLTAASGFNGSGTYLTTNATGGVTSSQPLTLAGNVVGGTLRTAGLNTVNITGASHTTTGVEVQGGTLKLAPTAGVTSTGTIKVFGVPASVASPTTTPVSPVTATLEFAPATTATHTGNITNSGVVSISSGTTTVTGVIAGSATTQFAPGLLEGLVTGTTGFVVDGTRPANPGNFGVQMEPRMLQNNSVTQQALTGHIDNEVWVYTGYVKDDDGVFSFAGNQDDFLGVWINGQLVLNQGGNVVGSTAYKGTQAGNGTVAPAGNGGTPSQNFGPGVSLPGYGTGWHLVEIRMRNGTGGAGPWGNNGFLTNYGFGYKNGIGALDGGDYIKPIDDGTGSLFVTPIGSKGDITLADGTTLNAGGFQATRNVVLRSNGNTTSLNITAAGASDAESIAITDPNTGDSNPASGIITLAANAVATTQNLSVVAGGSVSMAGDSGSSLTVTGTQTFDGSVTVDAGTLNLAGVGSGSGIVSLNDGILNLTGSITGAVAVNAGILTGSSASPTTGAILGTTDLFGGTIKPGSATTNATGILNFDGGLTFGGATAAFDLNGTTAGSGFDQLNVSSLNLAANVPFSLSLGFAPAPMTSFVLIDADSVALNGFQFSFAGDALTEGETFFVGINEFTFSYVGGNGNDPTVTFVVPEPGSAALLLGGLAMLAGRRRRKQA